MSELIIARDVAQLREAVAAHRRRGASVGLVPTMGALHHGHVRLIERAKREADFVLVSIFVNPTQFAAGEDLAAYPRTLEADLEALRGAGAQLAYVPTPEAVYPPGFATTVTVAGPAAAGLEDRVRPHHFAGVATVCAKLFIESAADVAVFGEKDYQQLCVVNRLARDLDIPIRIIGEPTIREADGLALSSRNRYLSAAERDLAPLLHRTLEGCARQLRAGVPLEAALASSRTVLAQAGFGVDYFEARDATTLDPVRRLGTAMVRLLAAARLGRTRLIDNVAV
jgi:pantoate--beta-alanine ligase